MRLPGGEQTRHLWSPRNCDCRGRCLAKPCRPWSTSFCLSSTRRSLRLFRGNVTDSEHHDESHEEEHDYPQDAPVLGIVLVLQGDADLDGQAEEDGGEERDGPARGRVQPEDL